MYTKFSSLLGLFGIYHQYRYSTLNMVYEGVVPSGMRLFQLKSLSINVFYARYNIVLYIPCRA